MKKANLYFGITLFLIFLCSGYYMQSYFYPENIDNLIGRMQIRSNHIYMLLIALLNIVSYKYDMITNFQFSKYVTSLARGLLIFSGILAILAFCYEHTGDLNGRVYTFFSVVMSVSAIGVAVVHEIIVFRASQK